MENSLIKYSSKRNVHNIGGQGGSMTEWSARQTRNPAVPGSKVVMGDTFFMSPAGYRTAILRGHPSHAKV